MNKENVKLIFAGLCMGIVLTLLIYAGIEVRVGMKLNLTTTYIAARDIGPRERIEEEDLIEVQIPEAYIQEYAVNDRNRIIGRYTDIQGKIPAGSAFYKSILCEENDMPDYPTMQLKEGQSAFTLEINYETMGGKIVAGQRVDIFVTIPVREGVPLTGTLVENARVISVLDHKGNELGSDENDLNPYMMILAVNHKDLDILTAAVNSGSVRLFASDGTYDVGKEARLIEDSRIMEYLRQNETEKYDIMDE